MKKIITLLLIISCTLCISQNTKKFDIHIKIDNLENHLNTENDSIVYQYIVLKNQRKEKKNFIIDENGNLLSKVNIKASNKIDQIFLVYSNTNNDNIPLIKKSKDIKNIINYPNDFIGENLESIFQILKKASNIYIIEKNEIFGYDVLKKVRLKI